MRRVALAAAVAVAVGLGRGEAERAYAETIRMARAWGSARREEKD